VFKKSLFPRFVCSGVNVTVFVEFNATVRVASSNSIAYEEEVVTNNAKMQKIVFETDFNKFFIFK
jgi:hypothetical protein